jgi:ferredoxin/flavodoxin---NADP+ reductase
MLLKVTQVEHYTDTLFKFRTERPAAFKFSAGEFTMIGMADSDIMRAYSITSGPYDEYLEFYSIKVQDGPLTSKLQKINVGDEVEVGQKPTGTLTHSNLELSGDLWLLATGTGIAPFISLLRDPATYELFDYIRVLWSVREQAELLAYDEFLRDLDIEYLPIVTQDPEWPFERKRITTLMDEGLLINDMPELNKVMICGSMPFNNDVKDLLIPLGWEEGTRKTAGTFVQEKAFVS